MTDQEAIEPLIRVERSGPVTTIMINRPAVRNAVDRPTAEALADAFRAFDSDRDSRVAVLAKRRWELLRGSRPQVICQW